LTITGKQIGITGASGYVGGRIMAQLEEAGFDCVALVRKPGSHQRYFELGKPLAQDVLSGIKTLVHCAWDLTARNQQEAESVNVAGSAALIAQARSAGVEHIIFISSMSAFPGCHSVYGQSKLAVEKQVLASGGTVIRPGLVYDENPRGITGTLAALAQRTPVLPMIGMGRFKLHPCHADDLAQLLVYCCSGDSACAGVITAAQTKPCEFRDIVRALAKRKLWFLPCPWQVAWMLLAGMERLGIRPPLKSDSLIGLVRSDPNPDFSMTHNLPVSFRQLG
jgi:nucleoside-diphosphate-sugar epimerase